MPEYLAGAEPFFFPGNSVGCLLVHGFTGTPYEVRGLGEFLHTQKGYTIFGPALAGHATDIRNMVGTDWRDWYNTVDRAYLDLKAKTTHLFAIGLSLGAALVLHLAAHRRLDGFVSVSAPAYVGHPLLFWFRTLPFLFNLIPSIKKDLNQADTQDRNAQLAHVEYDRYPTRATASLMMDCLPHVRSHLPEIQTPALLLQGRQDRTIPSNSMPLIHSELGSKEKEMVWLEPSGHLALEDYAHPYAYAVVAGFIERHLDGKIS